MLSSLSSTYKIFMHAPEVWVRRRLAPHRPLPRVRGRDREGAQQARYPCFAPPPPPPPPTGGGRNKQGTPVCPPPNPPPQAGEGTRPSRGVAVPYHCDLYQPCRLTHRFSSAASWRSMAS